MPIVCDSREITKFGFSDLNTEYKKILFLGTHITQMSLDAGFYYFNGGTKRGGNSFWTLLERIYNSKELTDSIENYKKCLSDVKGKVSKNENYRQSIKSNTLEVRNELILCLQKHGIVINDLIGYCECDGARDDQIIEESVKPNDGNDNFHDVPSLMKEADLIVINGIGLESNKIDIEYMSARYFLKKFGFDKLVDSSKIVFIHGSSGFGTNQTKIEKWLKEIREVKRM